MSLSTLPPTVQSAGDDFDDWERELSPTYPPVQGRRAAYRPGADRDGPVRAPAPQKRQGGLT